MPYVEVRVPLFSGRLWPVSGLPSVLYASAVGPSVRTLLFSDIEGSTALLEQAGEYWPLLLQRHRDIMREAVAAWGGIEHATEGDSFFITFDSPSAALAAAVQTQCQLETAAWPGGLSLRVRMGLHLGEVTEMDGGLIGLTVHHAARVAGTAHGGQIVVSEAVRDHARVLPTDTTLRPLGSHRLRDVGTIALHQVEHPLLQRSFPELRGVLGSRTNLPRPVTNLVGGHDLLDDLDTLIGRTRIITLTGTGGVGKTRAALECAWQHIERFPDGVYFVDLAPLADEGAVPAAVAATMPMMSTSAPSVLDSVVDWVGARRLMLVIDNCEHVVAEVTEVVAELQARCQNVVILATSREALGVRGETVVRVPSLAADGDAMRLFCERAIDADASFKPIGHEATIEQICRRLDGIPLAIELAAARTRSLSPDELLERLQDRFRLLRGSGRGSLERHQTLRATVSWSYQLLSADEQWLFDRLSVFSGGFDLQSAEQVCGTNPIADVDVFDLVDQLVDKSMVVAERFETGTRYRLLETMRQFAEEQLELRGETSMLRDRHLRRYTDVALQLAKICMSARETEGSRAIDTEWDNLRAAHLWALATSDLDTAEAIVRSTSYDSTQQMRKEHKAWVLRTVELGDHLGRPAADVMGIHAEWLSIDGFDEDSFEWGQRGIAAAPAPDHPSTVLCWSMLAGAGPITPPGAPAVCEAFEHQRSALGNFSNLDENWWALVYLVDSAMNAAPEFAPELRQQMNDVASRVPAPSLVAYCRLSDGHALVEHSADTADFVTARIHYARALDVARDASDVLFETQALRAIALAAVGDGAPDAVETCREALEMLYEIRYWQKLWQALDSTTLGLASVGHTADAAILLGHLDAHVVPVGLEENLRYRDRARVLIDAAGGHADQRDHGARLTKDEVVAFAIGACVAG